MSKKERSSSSKHVLESDAADADGDGAGDGHCARAGITALGEDRGEPPMDLALFSFSSTGLVGDGGCTTTVA